MFENPLTHRNEKARRKPGPPRGSGEQVVVRLHDPLLTAIDAWCDHQIDKPTRAEAFRRFAARVLIEEDEGEEVVALKPRRPAKRKDDSQ